MARSEALDSETIIHQPNMTKAIVICGSKMLKKQGHRPLKLLVSSRVWAQSLILMAPAACYSPKAFR